MLDENTTSRMGKEGFYCMTKLGVGYVLLYCVRVVLNISNIYFKVIYQM